MTKDSADPTPAAPSTPPGRPPPQHPRAGLRQARTPEAGLPVDRVPGAVGSTGQEGTPASKT